MSIREASRPSHDFIRLRVEGLTCGGCMVRVERALQGVPGVVHARVNLTTETATIQVAASPPQPDQLIEAVRQAGYDAAAYREDGSAFTGLDRKNQTRLREQRQALVQAVALAVPILALHWLAPVLRSSDTGGQVWPVAIQAMLCLMLLGSSAGAPILVGGLRAIIHRSPNMDLLIALGACVAFVSGVVGLLAATEGPAHFHAVAMILAFINLGRYLEAGAKREASSAVTALARRMPVTAQVVTPAGVKEVRVEQVEPGDRIRVAPDTVVPVDGAIIEGEATVDTSAVTGESMPRHCRVGDTLAAGTVVRDGLVTLEATRVGIDSTMGRILRAVEDAQTGKTNMQRIADRVAGVFVPIVILLALATLFGTLTFGGVDWSTSIRRAVAVLVIACPCAMGLATPTAVLVASGTAALKGILVRDAAALEAAGQIQELLLDKTGTLTTGTPSVHAIFTSEPRASARADAHLPDGPLEPDARRILQLAASAEQYSQHPLARAIVAEARNRNLSLADPASFSSEAGRGVAAAWNDQTIRVGSAVFLRDSGVDVSAVEAWMRGPVPPTEPGPQPPQSGPAASAVALQRLAGQSVVLVAVDDHCIGCITIADAVRPEARRMIEAVSRLGVTTAMLTGDHAATAELVAADLGIDDVVAELTPEAKLAEVRRRRAGGARVAFVGDGINDAPALAEADVGITFATATDVALGAADITILHDDLTRLVDVIVLARRSVRIIRENLFWAFFYNVVAIPLAATGRIPPGYAAAAMMISSISVVLNSLRLRSGSPDKA